MIIAIEGIDGSGKTTQSKMLVEKLRKRGYNAIYVRPIYLLLEKIHIKNTKISPRKERTSGKSNKLKKNIFRILGYFYAFVTYIFMKIWGRGKILVCDRYFYQFFYDLFGEPAEKVIKFFPNPDVVFLLDGDIELFYSRMEDSFDRSVSREYYVKVIKFYRKLAERYNFIRIDASLKKEEINEIIFKKSLEKINKWGAL